MAGGFRLDGLAELIAELRALPADLAGEAADIVMSAAENAKSDMHYPKRTGDLAQKLKVDRVSSGQFAAGARVVNTSKIAHIFEHGSQARHTAIGANRGSMPPGNIFVRAVVRRRREMYEKLKTLLATKGLEVSGDA